MRNKFSTLAILIVLWPLLGASQAIYQDADAPIEDRVEDLLSRMTVYEKIGQMTALNYGMIRHSRADIIHEIGEADDQFMLSLNKEEARYLIKNHHIGSFLNGSSFPPEAWFTFMDELTRLAVEECRLGIPIIYAIDHVHGSSYLGGKSTVFPHNINMAATFNVERVHDDGWVTVYETSDLGHIWNYAPALDLGVNPIWPRFYETYGEDPYLASEMARAYVNGYQNNEKIAPYKVTATAKHFLGYSDPKSGWDRAPVHLGMQALHEFHHPPFQAAIDAGVKTVMVNSGEINGVPVHASRELLTDLLRDQMGFDGVIITDWEDIHKLEFYHKSARNFNEATLMAIEAGNDVSMTPKNLDFNVAMMELYEAGKVSEERIDESVRRVLRMKFELGLFENPYPRNDRFSDRIGTEDNKRKSLMSAEESIVLLRNENNVLPLDNPKNILLFGKSANSKRNLAGGWTIDWQGVSEDRYPDDMHTLYTALQAEYPNANIRVFTSDQIDLTGEFVNMLDNSDKIIYAGGEEPYAEFEGNIFDMTLPRNQLNEISLISKSSTPLTLIMVAGRPRIITEVINQVDAFMFAGLPGYEGADAIVNILSGKTNPSGKLPFSYPQYTGHFLNYNHKPGEVYFYDPRNPEDDPEKQQNSSLFEFGDGLSYTTYEYSNLRLSDTSLPVDGSITASVTVTNTGNRAGMESILWFLTNHYGTITRPVRELKSFEKVELQPGESKDLTFEIEPMKSLAYPDEEGNPVLERGSFTVRVDDLRSDFKLIK